MTDKKSVALGAAVTIVLISNALLTVQIAVLKKTAASLSAGIEEAERRDELLFEKINEEIILILDRQEENQKEIKNELVMINRKSDTQFSKTVSMSKTYDAILEERKKKTIDASESENAFSETKKNALALYKNGSYAVAYKEYKKLSNTNGEDMECRLYKAKSLFYMNRADSSKYAEILNDIKILRQNAAADDECLEIEQSILAEREGLNE